MSATRFLALFMAMALTAPAQAQVADPRDAVDAMIAAVASQDADAVAALYAPQSIVLGPGQPPLTGRSAIRDVWARNFQNGYSVLEVASPRTERGTDRAAMVFLWRATIQPPGEPQARHILGRSLLYFELTDGGWLISADMWQPPEPQ